MDLGSGIALGALCVSGGAVAITAVRTFCGRREVMNGKDGINGKNGLNAVFPCKDHSGIVVGLNNIKENQDKQEKWLGEISRDVKELLQR